MNNKVGKLTVFSGTMFSGKTSALVNYLRRSSIARKKVILFKHSIDKRYSMKDVYTHSGDRFEALPINNINDILDVIRNDDSIDVIGIDEIQFFDAEDTMEVINKLVNDYNKEVVVAGLDMDYKGRPFGVTPFLLSIADDVKKFKAVCKECGNDSIFEYRIENDSDDVVQVGGADSYISLCRSCWNKKMK